MTNLGVTMYITQLKEGIQMARSIAGHIYLRGTTYWLRYNEDGKRIQTSLKTKDKEEAKRRCDALLTPIKKDKEAVLLKSLIHELRDTEDDIKVLKKQNVEKLLLSETWKTYLRSATRPDTGPETLKQYVGQWNRFSKWCQSKKLLFLNEINQDIAEVYYHDLRESSYAAGTINKHIGLVKLVYRILGKQYGIFINPFDQIQKLNDRQNHRKEIPEDILQVIIDTAGDRIKNLLILGCETGLRLGDCCCLEWTEVNLTTGWIIIDPS